MIDIGKMNKLTISRMVEFGAYLSEGAEEVLLPRRYVPEDAVVGQEVEVFIYHDSQDRLVATTQTPVGVLGQVVWIEAVAITDFGAFMNWGLDKDLLVPLKEMKHKLEEGDWALVYLLSDPLTDRVIGSTKLERFMSQEPASFTEGQLVEGIIAGKSDMGYRVVINHTHWGLLYKTEVYQPLRKGEKVFVYIKKVREDGKIDLTLHKEGYKKVGDQSLQILEALKSEGGFIAVTDKSPPETIYRLFGISKKSFKMAVGALYKKRLITLESDGLHMVE